MNLIVTAPFYKDLPPNISGQISADALDSRLRGNDIYSRSPAIPLWCSLLEWWSIAEYQITSTKPGPRPKGGDYEGEISGFQVSGVPPEADQVSGVRKKMEAET